MPALLALGFEREVGDSYRFALARYQEENRFALIITPSGKLLDFPAYAPDGFALFLHGLVALGDRALVDRYRPLLAREAVRFHCLVIDPATGLVRAGRLFSEAQDYVVRSSSCYSNAMCFVAQQALSTLGLPNPLARFDYPKLLLEHFWNEDHFWDDLERHPRVSGDAAIAPFWSRSLAARADEPDLFSRVLARLDAEGLTRPYPARYGNSAGRVRRHLFIERFVRWQRDTVWTSLGVDLLLVLRRLAPARYPTELALLEELVARHACFPEVVDARTGELFASPLYVSDTTMLWAAVLWQLLAERDRAPSS